MSRFGKLSGKLNIKKVMLTVLALIMVTICVTAMGINSNAKIDDKKNIYDNIQKEFNNKLLDILSITALSYTTSDILYCFRSGLF